MPPKLTIIIPCYNCAATLREAVVSCYTQGFSPDEFEVVMVNDCSTDTTATVMNTLASEYPNIHTHHHTENRGGGAARNTAIEHSRSDVIFCLDSDDLLPEGTLKKMYDYLQQKNCDGVCFEHSVKFRGSDINNIDRTDSYPASDSPLPLECLLQRNGVVCPVMVVFMFTKAAWQKVKGYPTHHGFDTQGFGWRFLAARLRVFVCPHTTYLHRVAFNESYYLREYNAGKSNINMKLMLLENRHILSDKAIRFIETYPIRDFTRILLLDFQKLDNVFAHNSNTAVYIPHEYPANSIKPVRRNSLLGIIFRIKSRIRNFL